MTDGGRADRQLILVVDDEWLIAAGLEADLIEGGYEVAGPVGSVRQALRLVESTALSGAVLDIQLMNETSFAIAAALKALGIPYIFVTGFTREQLPPAHRASTVLTKPVDKSELIDAVGGIVGREGSLLLQDVDGAPRG